MILREIFVRIIKDFEEFSLPDLVERDISIKTDIPINRVISIIGPRRTGKTYIMFQLIKRLLDKGVKKNRIIYINFESDLLLGAELPDLRSMIDIFYEIYPENKKQKIYLFLDEIQNIPNWEKFIRTIMDSEYIQIFISGSSSKLLSKEIATSLRGRTISYNIYTFNFNEFLKLKKFEIEKNLSSHKKALLLNLLKTYIYGSYPEAIIFEEERNKILKEILDVTIYKDIVDRYKVKNTKVLKLLFKALASSTSFSIHKFYNYLKSLGIHVSKNTVYNYVEYLSDSLILYTLRKYSKSYKELEQTIPKIYLIDNGLLFINGIDNLGRYIENVVFLELIRRNYIYNHNIFYNLENNKELDFVLLDKKRVKQLIQVCYSIEDFNTKERELEALINSSTVLGCKDLLVITWNYEATEIYKKKKIIFIPLWKWLLNFND